MKTIGIITTFRQPNWGSVLQAYALQKVLDDMGYEAWLIDYRYPNEFHYSRGIKRSRSWLRNLPGNIKNRIEIMLGRVPENKIVLLDKFIRQEMRVTRRYKSYDDLHQNPPQFDAYAAGSDQIWNSFAMRGDMSFMLDFAPNDSLKFSYASSFAWNKVRENYVQDYQKCLSRLKHISVREYDGIALVKQLIGKEAELVLDPTLLLSQEHWGICAKKARSPQLPSQYILCYMLGYTYNPSAKTTLVLQQLQEQYSMPVIALNGLPSDFRGEVYALPRDFGIGIEEFLYLMSNAAIVVSSSFHGTAFALNFNKPLVAIVDGRQECDSRLTSLLSQLGLTKLVVTTEDSPLNPFYDFEAEQTLLRDLRAKSIAYLADAVR